MTGHTGGGWGITADDRARIVRVLMGIVEAGEPRERIAAGRLLLRMHDTDLAAGAHGDADESEQPGDDAMAAFRERLARLMRQSGTDTDDAKGGRQ